MERFADVKFYREVHKGKLDVDDDELTRLLGLAARRVDEVTLCRAGSKWRGGLTRYQRACVKFATCFQAEYINEREDGERDVARYSAAGVSVTFDAPIDRAARLRFSPAGYALLESSGLLCTVI